MKNMRLILAGTLLSLLGISSAVAQTNWTSYSPTERATTLEEDVTYMIYNTAFNGTEDRTGFISSAASGFGHTGETLVSLAMVISTDIVEFVVGMVITAHIVQAAPFLLCSGAIAVKEGHQFPDRPAIGHIG